MGVVNISSQVDTFELLIGITSILGERATSCVSDNSGSASHSIILNILPDFVDVEIANCPIFIEN